MLYVTGCCRLFDIEPGLIVELMPGAVAIFTAPRSGHGMNSVAMATVGDAIAAAIVIDKKIARAFDIGRTSAE